MTHLTEKVTRMLDSPHRGWDIQEEHRVRLLRCFSEKDTIVRSDRYYGEHTCGKAGLLLMGYFNTVLLCLGWP